MLGGILSAFLSDGTVNLRPVTRADLPQLAAWRNDPELRARTREFRPLSDVDQERWLERISGADRRDFMFVVQTCDRAQGDPDATFSAVVRGVPIGVVGLCHWDPVNASAEVSFYIGDARARRKGYTKAALQLLHAWGFQELGLHRIWAECYTFNVPGQQTLLAAGYVQLGVQRHTVRRKDGEWASSIFYDLLEDEWRARS
jgi:ribosomal-protein-alanine N-acetyltransferase